MSKPKDMIPEAGVAQEADALADRALDAVAGGSPLLVRACATGVHLTPPPAPGGPVPMPYPVLVG